MKTPEPPLRPRKKWCSWYKRSNQCCGYEANSAWKTKRNRDELHGYTIHI